MRRFVDFSDFEGEANIFVDAKVWVESVALEDHSDIAVFGFEVADVASIDEDFAT